MLAIFDYLIYFLSNFQVLLVLALIAAVAVADPRPQVLYPGLGYSYGSYVPAVSAYSSPYYLR